MSCIVYKVLLSSLLRFQQMFSKLNENVWIEYGRNAAKTVQTGRFFTMHNVLFGFQHRTNVQRLDV